MMICIGISVVIYKWDSIKAHYINLTTPTPTELSAFNNKPLEVCNDILDMRMDTTISMLFLGNSITMTGVPEELPEKTPRGLAATSIDKDYVHLLLNKVASYKKSNIEYSVCNIAEFERRFFLNKFNVDRKFEKIKIKNPDYLIVQIGENVNEKDIENPDIFCHQYTNLLRRYPDAVKIITIPFWPSKRKQDIISKIAIDNHCYLVDLSHIGNGIDPSNFASSEHNYKMPGVGSHPGDKGMLAIANAIFSVINAQ